MGPSGIDLRDSSAWQSIVETGYDAVDLHGNTGWASGDKGRIARVVVDD